MPMEFFGWLPNPDGVAQIIADKESPVWEMPGNALDTLGFGEVQSEQKTVVLFDALREVHPTWKRYAQGIGDCVSWGWELGATLTMAISAKLRLTNWIAEAATEPIYGGSRVEAVGKKQGGYSDGSYGGAAAKWVTKWGVVLRLDHSQQTGVPSHDLRAYSADRAKDWGNFGCGGRSDTKLDEIAKQYPVKEAYLVRNFEQAASAITSGYPVVVCSGQGFSSQRDKDGFVRPSGSWAHCMCFTGVRWGNRPGLLLTNSWGNSWGTSNPFFPSGYWPEVLKCSAWVDAEVCTRMFASWEDSYALTSVVGLPRRKIDWSQGWNINGG